MNLLVLAPDIQEAILCCSPVTVGKDPITERGVRTVNSELEWDKQRLLYNSMRRSM